MDQDFRALQAGAPVGAPAFFQVVFAAHRAEVQQRDPRRRREVSGTRSASSSKIRLSQVFQRR
ncbi:hypothetical protein AB0E10_44265 [Streptomyces sp. NPDC048045]|uniref:hypothetical protein n=1 Tax=Streptomyces sp. NPDC048045 TaxID=3154710 RepID=UPI003438CF53